MYNITAGFFSTLYCWPKVTTIEGPFKCHEEILSMEPMEQEQFQTRSGKYKHVLSI